MVLLSIFYTFFCSRKKLDFMSVANSIFLSLMVENFKSVAKLSPRTHSHDPTHRRTDARTHTCTHTHTCTLLYALMLHLSLTPHTLSLTPSFNPFLPLVSGSCFSFFLFFKSKNLIKMSKNILLWSFVESLRYSDSQNWQNCSRHHTDDTHSLSLSRTHAHTFFCVLSLSHWTDEHTHSFSISTFSQLDYSPLLYVEMCNFCSSALFWFLEKVNLSKI